jgi:redox-regulated HSP33 family molecular chaperone
MSNLDKMYDDLENLKMVQYRMVADGFHYCFKHYSSFTEIEDEKFHELRKQYLESAKQLKDYIDLKVEEIQDNIDNIENI